jgi:CspA family cold shock protein
MARRGTRVKAPMVCTSCFLRSGPLPKQHGQVKWFNARKHYGFIVTRDGEDVFFHQEQLLAGQKDEPQEGQPVLFHTHDTAKGPEALNVELV